MPPIARSLLGSLLVALYFVTASGVVEADTFDEYELAESFSLPAGGGVFDFLNDGRVVVLAGADVYIETGIRSRQFDFLGSLQAANIPGFGAAFLRVSPGGLKVAVGNNQFGPGAEVGIFELIENRGAISVDWYEAQHFDATWYDDTTLLLTAGFDGTVVTVFDISNPDAPANSTIIDTIGGASAGVALDAEGNLYTGNGFQFGGPSGTGWIKYFSHADWTTALAGGKPIDFEASGILVVDLLSATALGFDAEGNLHAGGGDFGSDDNNYAGVVRAEAIAGAIEGADPADPDDPAAVLKLDPDRENDFNFYDVRFNRVTCELLIREGNAVYVYRGTNPYAAQVVEYVEGAGVGTDFISGDPFNDPATAFGRPTIDTTGDGISIPLEQAVPLVPVNAAFRAFELVSIGIGGQLTLKFNHPVEDHDCNPFGIDFIVYGNAFQVGGSPWTNGDPNAAVVGGTTFAEPAQVSVSQDGIEWFAFEEGPFADDFAPTLGRIYDPENADPSLFPLNEWWAQPTDPTKPLDPELSGNDLLGLTVAEAALLYDGAAGGTGFDLAESGLDWIQYVRIEPSGAGIPEIDAVADVAPAMGSETGADLNGDGVVDAVDLATLLASWGPCDCCPADLNGDGMVGPVDLATLLASWG